MRSVAIIGALLASLAASSASAQEAPPRDPLDTVPVRLGPVGLTPSLTLRDVGRDNNVFNESEDPKSDFTATISPKLDGIVHSRPMTLTFTTTTDYVYYQTYASERSTNVGSTVRVEFALGPVKPFVSASGINSKERINREIDARARHRDRGYNAGARIQIFEGLFATVGARRQTTNFEEDETFRGESLAAALNSRTDGIDGGAGVALTPLTTVSVTASTERTRFDIDRSRDSDTLKVMPTVTFSPLAMLNGSAAFGYRRFRPRSADVPDYNGFVALLTLAATLAERHRIETAFSRDVQYSYDESDIFYVETAISGTWRWHVAGPFDFTLGGSRSRLHYPSPLLTEATDEDTTFTYNTGLSYRITATLRAGVNGEFRQRQSERGGDRAFDNRRIFASVTWGKQ